MHFTVLVLLVAAGMLAGMLAFLALGRWLAGRRRAHDEEAANGGGTIEGAVFALFGLLIAFTFSSAAARFDHRRELILSEANAIGTAYLRVDLLPAEAQPALRVLFRQYVESRLATYRKPANVAATGAELERSAALQAAIWNAAVSAARATGNPATQTLVVSALNDMIDIATTRLAATRTHVPNAIMAMLLGLALAASLVAGHAMGGRRWSWFHALAFALVATATIYVVVDLEYPRLGFIRVDDADRLLREVLQGMK